MKKFIYEAFEEKDIEEILSNIEYDLFEILDGFKYGDYMLTIFNEREKIVVSMVDDYGHSENAIDKEKFLEYIKNNELEKYLNNVLYYNYISNDIL